MPVAWTDNLKGLVSWREPGGIVSSVGHALVLVAGVYSFSSAKPFQPAQEAVGVRAAGADPDLSGIEHGRSRIRSTFSPQFHPAG